MRDGNRERARIGLFGNQVPREVVYASGLVPVRVFPSASKPTAAETFLPRNFCSQTKLILASFLEDQVERLDAVIFSDEDDSVRRLHDVWLAQVSVPVWSYVEVPRAASDHAVTRYVTILKQLAATLGAHTGRAMTRESLLDAITLFNHQRRLVNELKTRWIRGALSTPAYRRQRQSALSQDPLAFNDQLNQMLNPTDGGDDPRLDSSPVDQGDDEQRLMLLGELAPPPGLVRLVEGHGWRVAAEDSDIDEREPVTAVPVAGETVDALLEGVARAYLGRPPAPRMRDLHTRFDYLSRLVDERRIKAAICAYNKFCDLYLAEFPVLQAYFKEMGVPVLLLELEDQALSGQHRTRVEAFLEMVGNV